MASNYLREWRRRRSRADAEAESEDSCAEDAAAQEHESDEPQEETTLQQGEQSLAEQVLADDTSELPGTSVDEQLMATSSNADSDEEPTLEFEHDIVDSSQSDGDMAEAHGSDNETGTVAGDLAQWATASNQTLSAVNGLLGVLRRHGHRLPKDARTLLQTPKDVQCQIKCNGQYAYYGLESGILDFLTQNPAFTGDVELTFNVDGVPVFKSTKKHFWPILATCAGSAVKHSPRKLPSSGRQASPRVTAPGRQKSKKSNPYPMSEERFQRKVVVMFQQLQDQLNRIEVSLGTGQDPECSIELLKDDNDVAIFENKMKEKTTMETTITLLSRVGGKNTRDCTTKCLNRLMTNGVMAKFNMHGGGQKNKLPFKDTKMFHVIKSAVKRWSLKATDAEIESVIQNHLKHAPARSGGKS